MITKLTCGNPQTKKKIYRQKQKKIYTKNKKKIYTKNKKAKT